MTTGEALLLGIGGEDGLWMRLVGSGVNDFHRRGGLVVAPEGIAYQEKVADRPPPKRIETFSGGDHKKKQNSLSMTLGLSRPSRGRCDHQRGNRSSTRRNSSSSAAPADDVPQGRAFGRRFGPARALSASKSCGLAAPTREVLTGLLQTTAP